MNAICFISSQLDDYGLSAAQFRVYCHVARRSDPSQSCFESVEHMAAVCRLEAGTVRRALQALTLRRLLHAVPRSGETTLYQPALPLFWEPLPAREYQPLPKGHGTPRSPGHRPQGRPPLRPQGNPSVTAGD